MVYFATLIILVVFLALVTLARGINDLIPNVGIVAFFNDSKFGLLVRPIGIELVSIIGCTTKLVTIGGCWSFNKWKSVSQFGNKVFSFSFSKLVSNLW